LFGQAMQKKAGPERARFLSEACQGHPEFFEQLKTLIQAHDEAGDFLQPTRVVTQLGPVEIPDQVIGRYKLLERVGEGGWGTVYVAEQQALALMDHPNIAIGRVAEHRKSAPGFPTAARRAIGSVRRSSSRS